MARVNRIEDGAVPISRLSRLEGEGVAQRRHPGSAGDVEKTAGEPEILEERPEVLSPFVAVEREAPEVVEQNGGDDHVEHEQQRCLAAIKIEQNAHRAEHLEHAAEHQQQRGERGRQRDQTMARLRHGRLVIENLVERAERKDEHQTQSGDEVDDLVRLAHCFAPPREAFQHCRYSSTSRNACPLGSRIITAFLKPNLACASGGMATTLALTNCTPDWRNRPASAWMLLLTSVGCQCQRSL